FRSSSAQADHGAESYESLSSEITGARYTERAADGTDSHEREQIAVGFGTAMEDVFHEDGEISAHRHGQEGHAESEQDQGFHGALLARELNALLQAGEHRLLGLHGQKAGADDGQRENGREER